MKYLTIETDNSKDLDEQVNAKIAEGWEPLGGPSYHAYESQSDDYRVTYENYIQAMILRDE